MDIGSIWDDDNGEDSGSAYVFRVGPDADGDGVMDACLCPGDLTGDFTIELADLAIRMRDMPGPDCLISGGEPVVQLVDAELREHAERPEAPADHAWVHAQRHRSSIAITLLLHSSMLPGARS